MSDKVFNLSAGVPQLFEGLGDYWYVIEASGPVGVSINGERYTYREQGQGHKYERSVSDRRAIRKGQIISATNQTVRLYVGDVPFQNDRTEVNVTASATVEPGNNSDAVADVTILASSSGLVAAANANQKAVIISLDPNQPEEGVRIATAGTVAANRGIWLGPGASVEIPTTAAVYAYNLSTTSSVDVGHHPVIRT